MPSLEEQLLDRGLLSAEAAEQARRIARATHKPIAEVLVESGMVSEESLLALLAQQQGLEFVRLAEARIDPAAVKSVPAKLASHYTIMPVRLDAGVLTIAVSNPLDTAAAEDIEAGIGHHVERVVACRSDILGALQRHYGVGAATVERILAAAPGGERPAAAEESHDLARLAEDASVVQLVNQLVREAIRDRATDIHFEVYRDGVQVRRRIDGILYETVLPRDIKLLYPAIVSRIKLMSNLNIVERRLPQDGRARVTIEGGQYDLRISVVPAVHGEDIVVRILPSTMLFDLAELGFTERQLVDLRGFIARPHGILFVTGPTGSGKSTTLYACLSELNTRDRKIITIEDPVEYELRGITQTQVRPAIGLDFPTSLRSMLRHDPDIMMVGEVRDAETARIAIQTSMTGHLVLSTLHTNDAASGAVRLLDMGIDPYLITSTVLAFIAQRLVRRICAACRMPINTSADEPQYRGAGCRQCRKTGYHGREAIAEFLPMFPEIQELILARASSQAVRRAADALGLPTLAQVGEARVRQGITTPEELLRVTTI